MNYHVFIFVLTCFAFKSVTAIRDSKTIATVKDLLNGLALETWGQEESECRLATEAILNGVQNNTLWATWVWDSMQLPVGTLYGNVHHLGNFDQCLDVPWPAHQGVQTQYCLVDVELTALNKLDEELIDPYDDVETYIGAKFRHGMRLNSIFLGVCLPASCKPESIAKISRHMFGLSHLPFKDVTVDPRDCQVAESVQKPIGYYLFWLMILVMFTICIWVYFFGNTRNKAGSTVSKVVSCFCLTRNFDALTKVHHSEIHTLHGVRAITCGVLVVAHLIYMSQNKFVNQRDAEKDLTSNPSWKLTLHIDLVVDTFFLMSGLLYFKGLLTSTAHQPLKILLKRYLRLLLPLYALSIICMTYVLPYLGSGPAWPRTVRNHFEACAKSWWRNLLMISNKVDDTSICSVTSWYLHCDLQLTVLGTAIFMVYRKNKRLGIIFCSSAFVLSIVLPAIWNYWQELPGIMWYDFGESLNSITNKVYMSVYTPFYTRAGSYLVGAALGYVMSACKPQNNRGMISKSVSIIGFMIGMSLMVLCLLFGVKLFKKEFSALGTAVVAASDRTVWSIGVCLIVFACEYGTLPIINDIMCSKVFVPLSKLSYSVYLCHTVFIYKDIFSLRTPATYNMLGLIINGLGYVVISYSVCYLVWLFIEAPVTNLINLLFDLNRSPKMPQQNGFKAGTHEATKHEKVL